MEVDGQKAWTQKLGPGVKGGTLSLATGSHKVTMTLLDPKGKVKETTGRATDNEELENEGKADQVEASIKDSAEKLKDAAGNVKDAFKK